MYPPPAKSLKWLYFELISSYLNDEYTMLYLNTLWVWFSVNIAKKIFEWCEVEFLKFRNIVCTLFRDSQPHYWFFCQNYPTQWFIHLRLRLGAPCTQRSARLLKASGVKPTLPALYRPVDVKRNAEASNSIACSVYQCGVKQCCYNESFHPTGMTIYLIYDNQEIHQTNLGR